MSRSILRRMAPFITGRIQSNQRLLSSALAQSSPSPESAEPVQMTDNCIRRLKELSPSEEKMLRLSVEAGGCSGFQYSFSLDQNKSADDRLFEKDGVKLVVDNVSYDFVKGATIDYVEELIRSAFVGSMPLLFEALTSIFISNFHKETKQAYLKIGKNLGPPFNGYTGFSIQSHQNLCASVSSIKIRIISHES